MGVRRGNGQALGLQLGRVLQTAADLLRHRVGNAEIIGGDQDGRIIVPDSQRLGPDFLCDAVRLSAPESETAQTHGIVRRDVDLGDTNGVRFRLLGERSASGKKDRQTGKGNRVA
jgi:hypothetical protein